MRILSSRIAAVTLLTSLTLAGCGGSSDSETSKPKDSASTPSATATTEDAGTPAVADGKTIQGDGYSYVVPTGWDVPKTTIPGTEATDTFVADLTDKDGFADNINVIKQNTAPPKPVVELKDELGKQLTQAGGKNVKVKETGKIDGEGYVHISSTQPTNLTEQYFVVHDGETYFITFSHSPNVSESDRTKVAASVLGTWKWAS